MLLSKTFEFLLDIFSFSKNIILIYLHKPYLSLKKHSNYLFLSLHSQFLHKTIFFPIPHTTFFIINILLFFFYPPIFHPPPPSGVVFPKPPLPPNPPPPRHPPSPTPPLGTSCASSDGKLGILKFSHQQQPRKGASCFFQTIIDSDGGKEGCDLFLVGVHTKVPNQIHSP